MTPHPIPLQGHGHSSANFSASLELTLREIKSSYISAWVREDKSYEFYALTF